MSVTEAPGEGRQLLAKRVQRTQKGELMGVDQLERIEDACKKKKGF